MHRGRAAKAAEHVQDLGLEDRIEIRNEDYMESDLHDASILYCGHSEEPEDVSHFEGELSEGSRFVSLFLPFVGIVPSGWTIRSMSWTCLSGRRRICLAGFRRCSPRMRLLENSTRSWIPTGKYRYNKRTFTRLMKERFGRP